MEILGEAALDEGGILHGWCWSPDEPAVRRAVEILIDEEIIATVIASRFRVDLRNGTLGDGYHGFMLTLTQQIGQAATGAMIRACDLGSGTCFWQTRLGAFEIPREFGERVGQLRAEIGRGAHASALTGRAMRSAVLANGLGGLGAALSARAGVKQATIRPQGFTLPAPAEPRFSAILDAGMDGAAALQALRLAAPAFAKAGAEALLTDDGGDGQTIALQRDAKNLKYLYAGKQPAAARRNLAAAAARGGTLVFLQPSEPGPADSLAALPAGMIIMAGGIADAGRRVAPALFDAAAELDLPPWQGFLLVVPRAIFLANGPFDATVDDGAGLEMLDFVLRAARDGVAVAVWRCAWANWPDAAPRDIAAGHRFAERWIQQ